SAPATIAVAPAGNGAPTRYVAEQLAEQLSKRGHTVRLTSERFIQALGAMNAIQPGDEANTASLLAKFTPTGIFTAGLDDASIVEWLDAQEAEHEFVIYECDPEFTPWTARCLRQADRVVLAASAPADPQMSRVEARLYQQQSKGRRAATELVLVHARDAKMPERAEVWLVDRPVSAHHHIREGNQSDIARLTRLLLGDGVGIVLSGGGARGFAHLGVLRALEECDVPIDSIGGTSMGAIIGGLAACGYSHEERMERARFGFGNHPPDKDYTLPIVAINHGGRSNTMLRSMYGDVLIENLWTPFFCVSTNLTRAMPRVARSGPLWKWVRASSSPPGLAPPVFDDGQLIADGGILDNLPVGVMRATSGMRVTIASDVGAIGDSLRDLPQWDGVSGWAVLWQRLRGANADRQSGRSGVPSLAEVLMLTSTINSVPAGLEARRLADLYLAPPPPDVKFMEWKAIDRVVDAGYRYAIERVREWCARV
ncbi:MAG TPA: patatin-like phospholipase family protein, partial [Casimicrobiaceae bacterium]